MKASFVGTGLLVLIPSAHALINLPSSEIDLTNTAGITYDSNLTGGPHGKEDTFVNYSPRLDFIRKAGLIQLQSNAGINFTHYFDQKNLDAQDVSAGLQLGLAEPLRGAFNGNAQASYVESAIVVPDINARIHSNTLTFGAKGQLALGRRTELEAGTDYALSRRSGGSDSKSIAANAAYTIKDFLRGTAARIKYGYQYTHSDASAFAPISIDQSSQRLTGGIARLLFPNGETTIHADAGYRWLQRSKAEKAAGLTGTGGYIFDVGIDGPFLPRERFPKLRSRVGLTYSQSATPGLNDDSNRALEGNLALDWQARERTQVGIGASQNRSLTITNLTATNTTLDVHANQTLLHNLSANAALSYRWSTYRAPRVAPVPGSPASMVYASSFSSVPRKDETLSFSSGLSYSFARVWMSNLHYEYRIVSSSLAAGDYSHHVVNLNVSCRY